MSELRKKDIKFLKIFLAFIGITYLLPKISFAQFTNLWIQTSNPSNYDYDDIPQSIAIDATGIYIVGTDQIPGSSDMEWRIEKRNLTTGVILWVQTSNPTIGNGDVAYSVTVDASGIYVAGYDYSPGANNNEQWHIEKRDLDTGSLIASFGTAGVITNNPSAGTDQAAAITVDASGIYLVGFDNQPGNDQWRMEKRDLITGSVIWTKTSNPSSAGDVALTITADASGIYVAGTDGTLGWNDTQWRIEKRNLNTGELITTFGTAGVIKSNPSSGEDEARAITIDTRAIYIAGYDKIPGNTQWRIEKRDLNTGELIINFGIAGVFTNNPSAGDYDEARAITIDASGIYVVGTDGAYGKTQWRIEKLDLTRGTIICTMTNNPSESWDGAFAVKADASGIYVAGYDASQGTRNYQWRIEKYNLCKFYNTMTFTNSCKKKCTGTATANPSGGNSPYSYLWNTNPTQTAQTITELCQGVYTIIIVDASGKIVNDSITVSPMLGPSISGTTTICKGSTTTLTGNGDGAYLWSNGANTSNITVSPSFNTIYTLTVTIGGCPNDTNTLVVVSPLPVASITPIDATCGNNNGGIMLTSTIGTPPFKYLWSNAQTTFKATGLAQGKYSVTITDSIGCSQTFFAEVNNLAQPIANAGDNITLSQGTSYILSGSGGTTYSWSPSSGLSCITCENPRASPQKSTTYYLSVTDTNGCLGVDSVVITVESFCDDRDIAIPNIFTPNNDGTNEIVCIISDCVQYFGFSIYDRWGKKIFETTSSKNCWDGTNKGKPINPGVFFYILEATLMGGDKVNKNGYISLYY